jgi:hypothetical protein
MLVTFDHFLLKKNNLTRSIRQTNDIVIHVINEFHNQLTNFNTCKFSPITMDPLISCVISNYFNFLHKI